MLSSKFLLLALGSLILYSCYINFIYVGLDQDIYPVYLYDPLHTQGVVSSEITEVESLEELKRKAGTVTLLALTLQVERRKSSWFHQAYTAQIGIVPPTPYLCCHPQTPPPQK